jgi:anaerobic selenocysteine-containing dehydrogenase
VLAAMLGQIGLPGGGFGHGYGSSGDIGNPRRMSAPRLSQGANGIDSYIPVARIADMLLPGAAYDYDGKRHRYPDVKLVYWSGGNPFHHHQDLARLREAFARPQTVVVHDPFWTATARHADIVVPSTMSVERDESGLASCSYPPAPGMTPIPPTRPSAATATRTCSPPTAPARLYPRARPASSPWSRSSLTLPRRPGSRVHRPPVTAEPIR